jgi:hypothetical protein
MKRWSATLLAFAVCSAVVHADVTIVQKTTAEGGMATMMPGGIPSPTITTRIKSNKGRMDMDMGPNSMIPANISTITDADAKQVIVLDHNQKTAHVSSAATPAPAPSGAPAPAAKIDTSVTPTGQSQTIDGFKCDEYAFTTAMNLSDMNGGSQMPPEAAQAMQGVSIMMKGSIWVAKDAPGAAEYAAYQKAMTTSDLVAAAMSTTGVSLPGMDKMSKLMGDVKGLPVLTEITMTIEGQGQMADMMKQMGAMRVTTKVLSVKTDTIGDEIFKVPEGYQIVR